MKIFLDSSFLIALINDNDALHNKALEYVELTEVNECYISNLIINEVITVIGNKLGLEVAISSYDILTSVFNIVNEYDLEDFNYNTMLFYEKYNTKLSFTDSSILFIMEQEEINNLLSFDKEFKRVNNINLIEL
ncbi:type II toxin-antitoxin system VapC family toxin [uncultured Methanobrevibacter sp.]|uniref:type II toxin-antitoxin system VapC family toxin n=1 Tax=uncultured Methanobrevibacter sp. TaxID=253161 RepID=UPI0025F5E0C8|nr:PIN domain-containing protein [uncultured Methanobrevibacter sp.]